MLCLFFFLPSRQFILQLLDPGLGRQPGLPFGQPAFLFGQPAFPLLFEGGNFLTCLRVAPAELTVLPPHEEAQHGAVALQDAFLDFLDWDWIVVVVCEPVSSKHQYSLMPSAAAVPTEDRLAPSADQIYQWLTGGRLQLTRVQELLAQRGPPASSLLSSLNLRIRSSKMVPRRGCPARGVASLRHRSGPGWG